MNSVDKELFDGNEGFMAVLGAEKPPISKSESSVPAPKVVPKLEQLSSSKNCE